MTPIKNTPHRHTMQEVAKRAHVSIATVSRTLHTPNLVSPKTRKRVQRVIAKLDYTPNTAAQNLRLSRTNIIVILLPDIGNSFFSAIIRGMQTEAAKQNYDILIAPTDTIASTDDVYRKYISQRLADGILTLNGELPIPEEYLIGRDDIGNYPPIVMVCELLSHIVSPAHMLKFKNHISTVTIDNVQSAYMATQYLSKLGHRNIVHITGPQTNVLTWQRVQGFKNALADKGVTHPEQFIIKTDSFNTDAGRYAFDKVCNHPKNPTAVFCASDTIALGFISACHRHNIPLPQKYSIVGFDNIRIAKHIFPPLTTIHQPREAIGKIAMRTLIQHIKDRHSPIQNIVLNTELILRESVIPYSSTP